MSDTNVSVNFGGDTSGLTAAIAQARAAVLGFAPGATANAKSSLDAFSASMRANKESADQASAGWRENLQAAANAALVYQGVKTALSDFVSLNNTAARATLSLDAAIAGGIVATFRAEAGAIAAADSALIGYFTDAAYAQRGTQMFTVANEGLVASAGRAIINVQEMGSTLTRPFTDAYLALRIYTAGVEQAALASIMAAGNIKQLNATLNSAGIKESADLLSPLIFQLEHIPGVTNDAAVAIVDMLTTIPDYTPKSLDVMVQLMVTMASTEEQAKAMAKSIADAFKDPVGGGAALGGIAAQIKNMDALRTVTEQWKHSLAPDQAVSMFDTITKKLGDQRALLQRQISDEQAKIAREGEEGDVLGTVYHYLTSQEDTHQHIIQSLDQTVNLLKVARDEQAGLVDEVKKEKEYRDALGSASTPTSRIHDLEDTKKNLQQNTRTDRSDQDISDDDKELAIHTAALEAGNQGLQGLIAVLNTMKNRLDASYGDYGDTLGAVIKTKRAYTAVDDKHGDFDPSQTARAGASEVAMARQAYDKTFGDNPDDDPTKGATHYYNPAGAQPYWAPQMANQSTIGDHKFGNPDGPPVPSSDDATVSKEAIAQTNTALREQNALLAGGTDEQKSALAVAESNLTNAKDAVAEAQKLVDVRKAALGAAKDGTPQEQFKAQQQLVQAEQTLKDAALSRDQARNALSVATAQQGSRAQLDATLAGLNAQQAAYAKGSAEYLAFEKQKVEATKTYNAQKAADATEVENEKFDAAQKSFTDQRQLIEENMKNAIVATAAGNAAIIASYSEQQAAARTHYEKLAQIARQFGTDSVTEVRNNARDAAREQTKMLSDQVVATQKATADMEAAYKQHFGEIGSTVSSDIMGILEGTKKFSDVGRDVAKNIASQFVSAGVKIASDWAAHQAFMVANTVLSQTLQTGVVATGEAARTGLVSAGAAAQAESTIASMMARISASAAETFAGIFGFLSPVLGPAAAGPAAVGQATVMGAAAGISGFAIGSWSLPSDQLAMVHAGEMIVPASATPWAQSLMAAAGGGASNGGGGSGGGDIHFHISAMDGQSVMSVLKRNANDIAKMVSKTMGPNPSTRGTF